MNLEDAIKDMQTGVKRYKVIIVNQKSNKYLKEIEELKIKTINLDFELSQIVKDLSPEEKSNESWDLLKNYFSNLNDKILAISNIDYIFSPEVGRLNPVHNFNYFSRDHQIFILVLNARRRGNNLIYSNEGMPDYIEMDISENEYVLGWDDDD